MNIFEISNFESPPKAQFSIFFWFSFFNTVVTIPFFIIKNQNHSISIIFVRICNDAYDSVCRLWRPCWHILAILDHGFEFSEQKCIITHPQNVDTGTRIVFLGLFDIKICSKLYFNPILKGFLIIFFRKNDFFKNVLLWVFKFRHY